MKIVKQDKEDIEFFGCDCHSFSHGFGLWFMDEWMKDPCAMYLEVLLESYLRWWKRLFIGWKFTFCNKSYNTLFCNILISPYDMDRLINILQKMVKETDDSYSKSPVEINTDQYLMIFNQDIDKWEGPNNEIHAMSELTLSVEFPRNLGFFHRLWRSIKFAWGWQSRFNNTDCEEINEQQAKSLIQLAKLHRDFSEETLKEIESAAT
jgi:hypothetical protein